MSRFLQCLGDPAFMALVVSLVALSVSVLAWRMSRRNVEQLVDIEQSLTQDRLLEGPHAIPHR